MISLPFSGRLICGDALIVLKSLPDKSVDLIVTDPPYGDNIGYGVHNRTILGNEHPLVGLSALSEAYRVLKANSAAYVFCGTRHLGFVSTFFQTYTKYKLRDIIIWDKVLQGRGHGFRRRYECIVVLEKGRPIYRRPGFPNLIRCVRTRYVQHPHEKPVELLKPLIEHSSEVGDIVLDPFLGSGSSAVAARELGRGYIGIELDPTYCKIAEARLNAQTVTLRQIA
ncbi:MAG: site-specific DNA-methyltransferase [Pyrinomonadaceae bacterium]